MKKQKADVGFVVDPDVDRLAILTEKGDMFGEEYTLVAVADYILSHTPGNTVSNMGSTRALRDVTEKHGKTYTASAVGEVNVVKQMKDSDAVIGGEGNGGVIYPASHYGRDALVGIGLFLTHLAKSGKTVSALRATYPDYFMAKQRLDLKPGMDADVLLEKIKKQYAQYPVNDIDGVKVDFPDRWVHFRKSNTEPIMRIYTEAPTQKEAEELALSVMESL
jgi:phosphomannomutase